MKMEQMTGIEPAFTAWEAVALTIVLHPRQKMEPSAGLGPALYEVAALQTELPRRPSLNGTRTWS